jgi:hypothetical protein
LTGRVPTSLEVLRQQARDELAAVIEQRCRLGEDPWEFIPGLPSVDEHVVDRLRDESIEAHDLRGIRARAHHPSTNPSHLATFEYEVLRRIALDHPDLTRAVWRLLGRIDAN